MLTLMVIQICFPDTLFNCLYLLSHPGHVDGQQERWREGGSRWGHPGFRLILRDYALSPGVNMDGDTRLNQSQPFPTSCLAIHQWEAESGELRVFLRGQLEIKRPRWTIWGSLGLGSPWMSVGWASTAGGETCMYVERERERAVSVHW